jgi:tetraacyldisaccharide 4'-kinase
LPLEIKPKATRVFLLTAIARPERFRNTLINMGVNLVGDRAFMDHHPFSKTDLEAVAGEAKQAAAEVILTTEKDNIRIEDWPYDIPLTVAGYTVNFEDKAAILRLVEPAVVNLLET